jgi:hypothetical protein
MSDSDNKPFDSSASAVADRLAVKEPFEIEKDNQRRYIRLEILSPVVLAIVKDIFGNFHNCSDDETVDGSILNISPGGILVELSQPVNEGDIVSMTFSIENSETLDNVLGVVKRLDINEGFQLAGIEFVKKDRLTDRLSKPEMEVLDESYADFAAKIRGVLKRHVYLDKTPTRG